MPPTAVRFVALARSRLHASVSSAFEGMPWCMQILRRLGKEPIWPFLSPNLVLISLWCNWSSAANAPARIVPEPMSAVHDRLLSEGGSAQSVDPIRTAVGFLMVLNVPYVDLFCFVA